MHDHEYTLIPVYFFYAELLGSGDVASWAILETSLMSSQDNISSTKTSGAVIRISYQSSNQTVVPISSEESVIFYEYCIAI